MPRATFEPVLDRTLPCTPGAPAEARHAVAGLVADGVLEPDLLHDVQLVVSEVVTNSVRHSGSNEPIRLRAWRRSRGLKVEIADGGFGFEPGDPSAPDRLDRDAEGGRGLLILESLADRWGVSGEARTRVWFEIDSPSAGERRAQVG